MIRLQQNEVESKGPCFEQVDRGTYCLTTEMFVPLERPVVFDFFSDVRQLGRITPDYLNFVILTPLPIEMGVGTLLDYRLSLRGIRFSWQTEICGWDPPFRFDDQQKRGPYRKWFHEHVFEEVSGGTRVLDRVTYQVPLPGTPLGRLIHRWFVKSDLEKIFAFRQDKLTQVFNELVRSSAVISEPTPSLENHSSNNRRPQASGNRAS